MQKIFDKISEKKSIGYVKLIRNTSLVNMKLLCKLNMQQEVCMVRSIVGRVYICVLKVRLYIINQDGY